MAEYTVRYHWIGTLEVEADSEEEALEMAKEEDDPRSSFWLDDEDYKIMEVI